MAVEVAQLFAKIGTDTTQAQSDLRNLNTQIQATSNQLDHGARQVELLTDTISSQEHQLKSLEAQLSATNRQREQDEKFVAKAGQSVEQLTNKIALQARQLDILNQEYQEATTSGDKSATATERLKLQIDKLATSIDNNRSRLDAQQSKLGEAQTRLATTGDTTAKLSSQIEMLSKSVEGNRSALDAESKALDSTRGIMKSLEGDLQRLQKEQDEAAKKASAMAEVWIGALRRIGEIGVDSAIGAVQGLVSGIQDFIGAGVESYGVNQQLAQSFESLIAAELMQNDATLTRNQALEQAAQRSQELLDWNSQLAINSPFSEQGVAQALRMSMAYGFNSEEAQKLTQTIIDTTVAMGGGEDIMQRVALALGQIEARGKTSAEEFNQLAEAGINVRQILSDAFGVPIAEIDKLNEAGKLTADIVIPAITERLGRDFGGAAERSTGTVQGLQNAMGELYSITGRKLLDDSIEAALPYVERFIDKMQEPETQARIEELSEALGEFTGNALAELVDTGGRVIDRTTEIYDTLEPLITFVGDNAIPIVGGLAAAYSVQLAGGIAAALPSLLTMNTALLVQTGALGAVALAGAGVIKAYQDLRAEEEKYTNRLVSERESYQDSIKLMEDYNKLSAEQKEKLKGEVDAIIAQHERMSDFAEKGLRDANIETLLGLGTEAADNTRLGLQSASIQLDAMNAHFAEQVRLATEADKANADLVDTLDGVGGAAGEAAGGIDLMGEANARQQEQLDALAQRGQEAYEKLGKAAEEYNAEDIKRQQEHGAQIAQLYADYETATLAAEQARGDKAIDLYEKYTDQRYAAQLASLRASDALAEKEQERALNSQEKYHSDAASLIERWGEQVARFNEDRLSAEQDYIDKQADLQESEIERAQKALDVLATNLAKHEDKRLSLEQDYSSKRDQANAASAERYAAVYEKQQADYESYIAARARLDDEYSYESEQRERKLQDKLFDIQESLQNKLSDLRDNAAFKGEDKRYSFDDKQADREQDLADKLEDIDKQIAQASSLAEQEKLQAKRAAAEEQARIAMQRAERDYQAQLERDARDLARAEEQARKEAERAEEQARQMAERAERDAQIELERAQRAAEAKRALQVESYKKDFDDLQVKHNQELADLDRKHASEQEKLGKQETEMRAAYERQESEAQAAYDRQQEKLTEAYAKQLLTLQDKYNKELAEHTKALADNDAMYAEREAKAQAAYDRDVQRQQYAIAQKLSDIQAAYVQELGELQASFDKQNALAAEKLQERIALQNRKFEEQRASAATAYEAEQAALRENLGKQLHDYVAAQARMNETARAAALERQALIAFEYGYDPAAKVNEFNSRYNDFILSDAMNMPSASGVVNNYNNSINIAEGAIIPMQDFAETLQQQQAQLNALNGGTLYNGMN